MVSADQVKNIDSGSLVPVVMHGRLRGGSAIPGAWGAGPRKIAASDSVMPEIRVLFLVHPVPRSPLVAKQPILEGLLVPKLPL